MNITTDFNTWYGQPTNVTRVCMAIGYPKVLEGKRLLKSVQVYYISDFNSFMRFLHDYKTAIEEKCVIEIANIPELQTSISTGSSGSVGPLILDQSLPQYINK